MTLTGYNSSVEKEFVFAFSSKQKCSSREYRLVVPVIVPINTSAKEYAYRLIQSHKLPAFIETELISSLEKFVKYETDKFYDEQGEVLWKRVQQGCVNVETLAKQWEESFREETAEYGRPEEMSNEEVFSDVYHNLIHSPAMGTLLQLEYSYAVVTEELCTQRDCDICAMKQRHTQEMASAVESVGIHVTDDQVNDLAAKQFEECQFFQTKWDSELHAMKDLQKREFKEWVMKVYEDIQTNESAALSIIQPPILTKSVAFEEKELPPPRLEESYTILLGAQMKQMYNLRLLSGNILDLCKHKTLKGVGVLDPQPQRLQTAMSLYSSNLCGLVILVDNRISSYTGIKRDFAAICQSTTEFHFPELEDQLEVIRSQVGGALEWRLNHPSDSEEIESVESPVLSNQVGHASSPRSPPKHLQVGDFYITRHSNLAEVHVAFHMVVDDSLRSSDINSRHTTILGIRNVLKVACLCDITTITIPLLLVHEMAEEMTIPWCMKRAELVYKCVKGFMMEMASWGGSELKNLQFLVPQGISEEVFTNLANMLPSIFRMSNPLVMNSSSPVMKTFSSRADH